MLDREEEKEDKEVKNDLREEGKGSGEEDFKKNGEEKEREDLGEEE